MHLNRNSESFILCCTHLVNHTLSVDLIKLGDKVRYIRDILQVLTKLLQLVS